MNRNDKWMISFIFFLMVWISACTAVPETTDPSGQFTGQSLNSSPTPTSTLVPMEATMTPTLPTELPDSTPSPSPNNVEIPAGAENLLQLMQEDLVQHAPVTFDQVELVSIEAVDWPDAGLGCPDPATLYAPAVTPGFKVMLRANSKLYEYHTDMGQIFVLCEPKTGMLELAPADEFDVGALQPGAIEIVTQATTDLAQQLGVAVGDIKVEQVEAVVWPDGSLGCPEPGMMYTQALEDGMLIKLSIDSQIYQYHSGQSRGPFLCENPVQPPTNLKNNPSIPPSSR